MASSGRARRTGRSETASISAVYYTRGAGDGSRRVVSGVRRSSGRVTDPRYSKSWSEIVLGDSVLSAWKLGSTATDLKGVKYKRASSPSNKEQGNEGTEKILWEHCPAGTRIQSLAKA